MITEDDRGAMLTFALQLLLGDDDDRHDPQSIAPRHTPDELLVAREVVRLACARLLSVVGARYEIFVAVRDVVQARASAAS